MSSIASSVHRLLEEQSESNNSEDLVLAIEDLVSLLQQKSFLDLMLWQENPFIGIENGYRLAPESTLTTQFLDYLLVRAKDCSLQIIKNTQRNSKKLRFYSRYYSRKFPQKFFSEFQTDGHSFYVGSFAEMDLYILGKPTNPGQCQCPTERTAVSEQVADMIYQFVIMESLKKFS
jgi:hypothetical protein